MDGLKRYRWIRRETRSPATPKRHQHNRYRDTAPRSNHLNRAMGIASSLGPQDKSGLIATALPVEFLRAPFPIPDLFEPEEPNHIPQALQFGQRDVAPVGFTPDELSRRRVVESLLDPQPSLLGGLRHPLSRRYDDVLGRINVHPVRLVGSP